MSLVPTTTHPHAVYSAPFVLPTMNPFLSAAYISYYRYISPAIVTHHPPHHHQSQPRHNTAPNSQRFTIDSLLGLNQDRPPSTSPLKNPCLRRSDDVVQYPATAVGDGSSRHFEQASLPTIELDSEYSWLQCSRYRPPKLHRVKKDNQKKRKLGRNPRVPFSQHQVKVLEETFRRTHYLSSADVVQLAVTLYITETRVKIWFQNRRARERRVLEARERVKSDTGDEVTIEKPTTSDSFSPENCAESTLVATADAEVAREPLYVPRMNVKRENTDSSPPLVTPYPTSSFPTSSFPVIPTKPTFHTFPTDS